MIRTLAGLLVLAMAGLPVLAGPSWVLMPFGAAAAGLGLAGVLWCSMGLVAAGAGLSLVEFALALWLSAAPAVPIAIGLGIVLALALDVADFAARFRGAALEVAVLRRQARYWAGSAAVFGAIGTLAAGAGRLAVGLPDLAVPAAAALGAVAAIVGAWRALAVPAGHDPSETMP